MANHLEWELVPQVREDKRDEVEYIALEIMRLDALMQLGRDTLTAQERTHLLSLQKKLSDCMENPCQAAAAPLLTARPCWQEIVTEIYQGLDQKHLLPLDEFQESMGTEYDCSACSWRTDYPGISGIPCEFSLEPLLLALVDCEICETVQFELQPREMVELASELSLVRRAGSYSCVPDVDLDDYFEQTVAYLRFWADLGFGVMPVVLD
jgi:hypothetical protein